MRLSLRFIVPLLFVLGLVAYAVVPLVDSLTVRWFTRDLDIRANLVATTVEDAVQELLRAIRRITREEGLSAIIVEQHPQAILAISDAAAVLDRGTVVHSGTAQGLLEQPALLDRLLGMVR